MSSQPTQEGSSEPIINVSAPLILTTPQMQEGCPISYIQLDRIKEYVKSIRSAESKWFAGMTGFASAGLSFLLGLTGLYSQPDISAWLLTGFWVGTSVGFVSAAICYLGYRGTSGQRNIDIQRTIQYIQDIERPYRSP